MERGRRPSRSIRGPCGPRNREGHSPSDTITLKTLAPGTFPLADGVEDFFLAVKVGGVDLVQTGVSTKHIQIHGGPVVILAARMNLGTDTLSANTIRAVGTSPILNTQQASTVLTLSLAQVGVGQDKVVPFGTWLRCLSGCWLKSRSLHSRRCRHRGRHGRTIIR